MGENLNVPVIIPIEMFHCTSVFDTWILLSQKGQQYSVVEKNQD